MTDTKNISGSALVEGFTAQEETVAAPPKRRKRTERFDKGETYDLAIFHGGEEIDRYPAKHAGETLACNEAVGKLDRVAWGKKAKNETPVFDTVLVMDEDHVMYVAKLRDDGSIEHGYPKT